MILSIFIFMSQLSVQYNYYLMRVMAGQVSVMWRTHPLVYCNLRRSVTNILNMLDHCQYQGRLCIGVILLQPFHKNNVPIYFLSNIRGMLG